MSANLCWKPITKPAGSLPDALKFVLRDKGGLDGDGRTFTASAIPYLSGLEDAGVDGARELIDIIEKHEEVFLWLQY